MYTHTVFTVNTAEQDRKKYVLKLEKNLFWIKTGRRVWHLIWKELNQVRVQTKWSWQIFFYDHEDQEKLSNYLEIKNEKRRWNIGWM